MVDRTSMYYECVTLGPSWASGLLMDDTKEGATNRRAKFLHSLETGKERGIEFDLPRDGQEDPQLVADILEAVRRNPNVIGLRFDNMKDRIPIKWLSDMLAQNRVQSLSFWSCATISSSDAVILSEGLKRNTSLKELHLEYPTVPFYIALAIALHNGNLQLDRLNIDGFSQYGFSSLSRNLDKCMALKELILTPARHVLNLDLGMDEFAPALAASSPNLELFTLAFDHGTPHAVNKLLNALATKNIKRLSFASNDEPVMLDDASAMERFVAANTNLELFGLRNLHFTDMAGIFRAMTNHAHLDEIGLYNMLLSASNARELGRVLSDNEIPLRKLDIVNFGSANRHKPLVPALLDGLVNNRTLKFLDVYLNEIHNDDLHALATVLETNPHLEKLTLSQQYTRIVSGRTDGALVRLCHSLARNQGLTSLCFKWKQDASEQVVRALLDGVKANPTLTWTDIHWLPSHAKAELDFYVSLNKGPKQALHAPLSCMALAFERADKCRRPTREMFLPRNVTEQYSREELMLFTLNQLKAWSETCVKEKPKAGPPSVLYYFVRQRCDLFRDVGAHVRQSTANQLVERVSVAEKEGKNDASCKDTDE